MADPLSFAITVALNAAVMAMTAMNKIEGPRLEDLSVSTADFGTPLPQFYGTKRFECPCFYAEDIREEKHKEKTKGGKYTEYKYFGTWASFVADCPTGPIDRVLKIWLDRHIIYDVTGTSGPITPITGTVIGDIFSKLGALPNNVRIYLGTDDQSPDPRMVATVEDEEGPGTCPHYLQIAYIFFEDVPLEKFGNRLPQTSVVATRNFVAAKPYEIIDANGTVGAYPSPDATMMLIVTGDETYEIWHTPSLSLLMRRDAAFELGQNAAFLSDGSFYVSRDHPTLSGIYHVTMSGAATLIDAGTAHGGLWYVTAGLFGAHAVASGVVVVNGADIATGWKTSWVMDDVDGRSWAMGSTAGNVNFYELGVSVSPATLTVNTGHTGLCLAVDNGEGGWCIWQDDLLWIADKETGAITHGPVSAAYLGGGTGVDDIFMRGTIPGQSSLWVGFTRFSTTDLSILQAETPSSWVGTSAAGALFDRLNNAMWTKGILESDSTVRFLDRGAGGGWTLGAICEDVALQAGMEASDFDFTDLDQTVLGFSWTQGPAREIVGPLLELWDSDIRPHGFIQEGLKRGQPLTEDTIVSDWMVHRDEDEPLYALPQAAETDLPRRLFATFADPTMEEQPNTAIAQRNAASVQTNRELPLDLNTLSILPDDLQPLLERALRRSWVGATKPEFMVTPLEIRLEPADVREVLFDGERLRCRCVRTTLRADRSMDTRWEVDGEVLYDPVDWQSDASLSVHVLFYSPGGTTNGRTEETVPIFASVRGFVFDTPLLSDAHDQTAPFLYSAVGRRTPGTFPGAAIWFAEDDELDTVYAGGWDSFTSDEACTSGLISGTLNNGVDTHVLDEASEIVVTLPEGKTLSSVTEDELLASQAVNLALIGDELVQFRDATLTGTNEYTLTGFIRGVRGTEYAADDHAAGELFLLIDSTIHKRTIGATEIGDSDFYKASVTGSDLDTIDPIEVDFAANAHRPYSVAHLQLERDLSTLEWTVSWQRRTRIGGSTVDGQDVPLGETSELYRVKIMDGADVVESYDVTDEEKVYTVAEQTADWGSTQSSLTVEVCQVSPALSLEGFSATASA